jgi:uncharacterized protein (DUF58 family)
MNAKSSKWKKIAATLIIIALAVTLQAMFLPEGISSPSSPSYSVKAVVPPSPRQLQEGDNVTIWVNVTGGNANSTYVVNINVTNPANSVNTASVSLKTDATGYGNASVVYQQTLLQARILATLVTIKFPHLITELWEQQLETFLSG